MQSLSEREIVVIGECLRAVVTGPFLQDTGVPDDPWWEFSAVMGLTPGEVSAIANQWPSVDFGNPSVRLAVGGAIGNLLGYPHSCEQHWTHFISVSPSELAAIGERWRALKT